jgi:hypothetical protein
METLNDLKTSLGTMSANMNTQMVVGLKDLKADLTGLAGRIGLIEEHMKITHKAEALTEGKFKPEEAQEPDSVAVPLYSRPSIVSESQAESPYSLSPDQRRVTDRVEQEESEEEAGEPVNPGESSIPVNHTTGAARLLNVPPIRFLAEGAFSSSKIKDEKYPMVQEERRGLLRLYGRGEGTERLPGYDKDPLTDHGSDTTTPSDTSSDSPSPAGEWGQIGGPSLSGDHIRRGSIGYEGLPDLDRNTVLELVESYKRHINILHPILIPRRLDQLVEIFLKSIADQQPKPKSFPILTPVAGFVVPRHPDSPVTNKRKRSPTLGEAPELSVGSDHKPGHPYRSIGTALVLLVMALGSICQVKGAIPDCLPREKDKDNSWSTHSPSGRNGHPSSPLQSSPAMSTLSGLPSPIDKEHAQSRSRRTSLDGLYHQRDVMSRPAARNLDVIPGLYYFALATDIIGNQAGGNRLEHVHVNVLASLYHGQLGRPLESHSYLHQACRSLQAILRP